MVQMASVGQPLQATRAPFSCLLPSVLAASHVLWECTHITTRTLRREQENAKAAPRCRARGCALRGRAPPCERGAAGPRRRPPRRVVVTVASTARPKARQRSRAARGDGLARPGGSASIGTSRAAQLDNTIKQCAAPPRRIRRTSARRRARVVASPIKTHDDIRFAQGGSATAPCRAARACTELRGLALPGPALAGLFVTALLSADIRATAALPGGSRRGRRLPLTVAQDFDL